MTKQQILKAAISLELDDRMDIVDGLIASIDAKERREIDMAWAEEAHRRLDALKRGEIKGIPSSVAFKQLRAKYAK